MRKRKSDATNDDGNIAAARAATMRSEHCLLGDGVAAHHLDQVGHEVVPAHELDVDLAPRLGDEVAEPHEPVVARRQPHDHEPADGGHAGQDAPDRAHAGVPGVRGGGTVPPRSVQTSSGVRSHTPASPVSAQSTAARWSFPLRTRIT